MAVGRTVKSASKMIYDQLKVEISTCVILPQEVLVIDDLAKRFGVSRTPVREAFLALCHEGLLDARHHVGFIVPSVDAREIVETYSLRIMLEKEAARLSADRVTQDELTQLEYLMQQPLKQQGRNFHSLIAAASGWGVLAETIEGLMDKSSRVHALFSQAKKRISEEAFRSLHGHRAIYEALAAADALKAAAAMEKHLDEAKERILRVIAMI